MAARSKKTTAALVLLVAVVLRRRRRRRRNRRVWTRQWILNRKAHGACHQLMKEMRALDASCYQNFLRMNATTFEELLEYISPRISFRDTVMRQAISPAKRLALTLRFLATGM